MPETNSSRGRRSRAGLIVFLLVLLALAVEVVAMIVPVPIMTPSKFARAVWQVASGGGSLGAPSEEDVAKMAYRPLPYVMFGLKPEWTRLNDKTMTSNSLGFRGPEVELPKPAGRYRIVCLGGSTTYSDAVSDDDAYPLLLEEMLREGRPSVDIEVVNAGVPSYTTAESLANLAFRCLDLQPDAILIYQGVNDYRPRRYRNYDASYFHWRKIWDGTTSTWKEGEGELQGINAFIQHHPPDDNGNWDENVRRNEPTPYRRNLTSMAGIATAHGVRTIFVTTAVDEAGEFTPAIMVEGVNQHNQIMREVASQQGALFVDLEPQFPQGAGLFHDPVHLNAEGTRKKARIIADALLQTLW